MATRPLAVRILEQRKIAHTVHVFDSAVRDAAEVARRTGFPAERVYKTLVVEEDPPKGKPRLIMVPSDRSLDLKAVAAALGLKKARMASHRDAERYTGLQVGGISALALLDRGFGLYIDAACQAQDRVLVSAGQRGMDVELATADLLALTGARPLTGCTLPTSGRTS
jgi:Cys-tRNA(Pro)/Cys-tRNA(Cys) deacylase